MLATGDPETTVRTATVMRALQLLGVAYRWGGKDPARDGGLDCSGFVEICLESGGIRLPELNSHALWTALPTLDDSPTFGDLAFYGGENRAHHVVLVLGPAGSAVIGASGGGPPLDGENVEAYAARMTALRAGVRIEDWRQGGVRYRDDLLGFRRLPWQRSGLLIPS